LQARDEIVADGQGRGAGRIAGRVGGLQQVDLGGSQERILRDCPSQLLELLPGGGQAGLGLLGAVVDQADVLDEGLAPGVGVQSVEPAELPGGDQRFEVGRCRCRPVPARRVGGEQAERVDATDLPAEELSEELDGPGIVEADGQDNNAGGPGTGDRVNTPGAWSRPPP
jgi:hypothetical protein